MEESGKDREAKFVERGEWGVALEEEVGEEKDEEEGEDSE